MAAMIDMLKWDLEEQGDRDNAVYAWKFPHQNLSTLAQLIVNESQEAVLFSKGQLLGKFGPGKHTLTTENLPVLRKLYGIPFGGRNPFTAEVWFVNKAIALDVEWKTENAIPLRDPEFNTVLPLLAKGQFGVQVSDSEKFIVKLVGTLSRFDRGSLQKQFRGLVLSQATSVIGQKMKVENIGVLEVGMYLTIISDFLVAAMQPTFKDYGVTLTNFYVTSITIDENDSAGEAVKEAIAKRARMNIEGYTYQQARTFDTLEKAASNQGTAGGVTGAAMGLGLGLNLGNLMGGMAGGMAGNLSQNPAQPPQTYTPPPFKGVQGGIGAGFGAAPVGKTAAVLCSKCGTKFTPDAKFCPHCGNPYRPCPACGADNAPGRDKCLSCGTPLPRQCPKCGTQVAGGVQFCPECGEPLAKKCPKCGTEVSKDTKFCPSCGTRTSG